MEFRRIGMKWDIPLRFSVHPSWRHVTGREVAGPNIRGADNRIVSRLKSKLGTLALAALGVWIAALALFPNMFNSHTRHLRQVDEHLKRTRPAWVRFSAGRPEFAKVELSSYTGNDGMLAIFGRVPSEETGLAVSNFLQRTKPPRPIYMKALIIDEEMLMTVVKRSEGCLEGR